MRPWRLVVAITVGAAILVPADAGGSVSVGHSGWFAGNPLPQGNALHDVEMLGDRGYAVGTFGTMLRTDDGGATWIGLPTGLEVDLDRLRVIDPNTVVAAGGCAVRRSDDGGQTFTRLPWTASDVRCTANVNALFFPTPTVGYLLLSNGNVERTVDGGKTWSRRTTVPLTPAVNPASRANPSDLFFTSPDVGFAAIEAGVIFKTTDGGSTWTPVSQAATGVNGLFFPTPSIGYAVGDGAQILKTTNGGESWDQVGTDATNQDLLSIRCADTETCIATTRDGRSLIRTGDGGATWTSVSPANQRLNWAAFGSGPRVVAVGDGGVTVLSGNAGLNFLPVGGALTGGFKQLRAASPTVAYAFGLGGSLARTTDGGQTWTEMDAATSDDLFGVSFPTLQTGFALDAFGQLLRTDNAGDSWQILNTGSKFNPIDVLAVSPGNVILALPNGIRRSTNGGRSFVSIHQKGINGAGFGGLGHVGNFVFAWGANAIARSRDGGAHWKRVRRPSKRVRVVKVDYVTPRLVFLLDEPGRLWRSADSGTHWREVSATGNETGYDFDFSDAKHGWIALDEFGDDDSGYVLHTADGGLTWEPQLIGAATLRPGGLSVPSPESAFAVSESNGLFATHVGGSQGAPSTLKIRTDKLRIRKTTVIRISGRLTPALGGEPIVVSQRGVGRTEWLFGVTQAATDGTFTVFARVSRTSRFVAQWAGDDRERGAGTRVLTVTGPRPKRGARRAGVDAIGTLAHVLRAGN